MGGAPGKRTGQGDTRPEAERMWIQMMRQAPAWRKLEMVGQMHRTVCLLALSGLRRRHPHDTEETLRRRLAGLLLGPELANRVYGPPDDPLEKALAEAEG